jgi:hypothetical protein
MRAWFSCGFAFAALLLVGTTHAAEGPASRVITSFEDGNPFAGGSIVAEHVTDGKQALRLDRGHLMMEKPQDWSGYDYLKADVFTDAKRPLHLYVEIRDRETRGYWTRVNYTTIVPPGKSTLMIPTALYVGEKARPGRALKLDAITHFVISIGDKPDAPLFLDNIRLERDTETAKVLFEGLRAFDVGPAGSALMDGFTPLDEKMVYTKERGFGWKNARFWRGFDALQPDPLYRDFICVEQGGLAVDVPNGKYHVFVNMDSPSGFWGEVQKYRKRALIIEGVAHEDTMDLASFKKRYFRSFNREDLPADDTFDKYQIPYFEEKHHEVEVRDGQLNIEFRGEVWACSVSAIVIYPDSKAAEGKRFLEYVRERRRMHFNNAFKRVLNVPVGEVPTPTENERKLGFVPFIRDVMEDVHHNDRPLPAERAQTVTGSAFAGEHAWMTVSLYPLRDLGKVSLAVSELKGPGGKSIPASRIEVGHIQHRLSRVTAEGSVYTITPRHIMPYAEAPVPDGVTRTFSLLVKVPENAAPGMYEGRVRLSPEKGDRLELPLHFTVRKGTLDAVDVPAGPWSYTIDLPWYDDEAAEWNRMMAVKSLKKLREYGFTTVSGLPVVTLKGFKDKVPQFDFSVGDAQMKLLKENGFTMPVVTYCAFHGLNTYYRDEKAMKAAGFDDYGEFIKAIFGAIQKHADEAGWLPVYWNIGDEPVGDDVLRSAANAEAYRRAFPKGPPYFTAASSFQGDKRTDPHFQLSKHLHIADWNLHDEASVKLQHEAGGDWAFYNGGNRWTYGVYLYKAAKQHGMKYRLSWHWNAAAGDPYYALDCREDDYAWCTAGPNGELIFTPFFERLREGLGDYRRMRTLARLAREKADTPAAKEAEKLLADILAGFKLGDRELKGVASFAKLRNQLDEAIEKLR